jgi:hypothetical protein
MILKRSHEREKLTFDELVTTAIAWKITAKQDSVSS